MIVRAFALLLTGLLLLITGCETTHSSDSNEYNLTSMDVPPVPSATLFLTIARVMKDNGYAPGKSTADMILFEKKGSKSDEFVYGGLIESEVWWRVRFYVRPFADGGYHIGLTAALVQDHNSKTVEQEQPVTKMGRGRYRKLLEEIKKALVASVPAADPGK